ncbi:MAG: Asp-tRNA(Asn)/Glu-tRNA(Gln) amidotransferase GatCAB subunit C [Chloroflexi bacterium]|nr:Asp-tRNA(Asn)/Glu-tRNA(Gln) amidotransferase GatCAB subunit C [Chloroflexota bacterium]|tara:strand:- start:124 stop:417 length:294 start_codon:yes stop_codon:yes gene_type:complete
MERLSKKELQNLAKLSHLQLDEDESDKLALDLSKVLKYFSSLKDINTDNIKMTGHPLNIINREREDRTSKSMDTEEVLRNAPSKSKNFFKIKKVLDT